MNHFYGRTEIAKLGEMLQIEISKLELTVVNFCNAKFFRDFIQFSCVKNLQFNRLDFGPVSVRQTDETYRCGHPPRNYLNPFTEAGPGLPLVCHGD